MLKSIFILAVAALTNLRIAGAAPFLEERAGGVCNSGIYAELSILSAYPIALAFCSAVFPVSCTSATRTISKRDATTTGSSSSTTTTTTTTTITTTTSPANASPAASTTNAVTSSSPTVAVANNAAATTSTNSPTTNNLLVATTSSAAAVVTSNSSPSTTRNAATGTSSTTSIVNANIVNVATVKSTPTPSANSVASNARVASGSSTTTVSVNANFRRPSTVTTSTTSRTIVAADAKASAWSKCRLQPASVIKTLCSCIEKPTQCPVPKPCNFKDSQLMCVHSSDGNDYSYGVACGAKVVSGGTVLYAFNPPTYQGCLQACADNYYCGVFSYETDAYGQTCYLYQADPDNFVTAYDPYSVRGYYQGSC